MDWILKALLLIIGGSVAAQDKIILGKVFNFIINIT